MDEELSDEIFSWPRLCNSETTRKISAIFNNPCITSINLFHLEQIKLGQALKIAFILKKCSLRINRDKHTMKLENYKFLEKLGNGTHGMVYLLESNGKRPKLVVCKSVSSKNLKYAENEIKIIKNLFYKRVVRFYNSMDSRNGVYIMMEYANYGDLDRLNCFMREKNLNVDRNVIWSIFSQLIDALAYLHRNRIIHRDIKPGNILLNRMRGRNCNFLQVKLCDFSLSKQLNDRESANRDGMIVGTPYYMAPEIIQKKEYNYGVWMCGAWAL